MTVMFSALNASVLRPLPYPDPDRLVWLWKAREDVPQNSVSYEDFKDYRDNVDAFLELGAVQLFAPRPLVSGGDGSERISGTLVTPNLFSTLGVDPILGRSFRWDEAVLGGPEVAILSYSFWQSRFGGDPDVLGTALELDGIPTEIVGVMPQGFEFRQPVQVWFPVRDGSGATLGRNNNNFFLVGRLREDVTLEQAQAQVSGVAAQIQEANPDLAAWFHWLEPLHDVFYGDVRGTLLILFGVVALVPILACTNVASLSLARATSRNSELATRLALGAGRFRVVRQLLAESLVLALAGGAIGLALAWAGGRILRNLGPALLPRVSDIGVDGPVVVFSLLASLLAVPLFGVLPALRGTDFDLARALRFGGRGGGDGRTRARSILVVAQVAMSMALLMSSGLLLRSFRSLQSVDPGFRLERLLTATVQLPDFKFEDQESLGIEWDGILDRLGAIPGVEKVGGADWLPVSPGGGPWNSLSRPDRPLAEGEEGTPASRKIVSVDYFETLGTAMLAGRTFTRGDGPETPPVMILSEALATYMFPEGDPVGRMANLWGLQFEVVGVAPTVAEAGLGVVGRPTFYISSGQFPQPRLRVVLRTTGEEPTAMVGPLRGTLAEVDPDITVSAIQAMDMRVSETLAQPRFRTGLVGIFALGGLLMAAFGLYGVLAFLVTRRRHEIGIRMAVGARRENVVGMVFRHGLNLVGIGVAVGILGGWIASRLLQSLLFGVSAADPITLVASGGILLVVAVLAALMPAWKATRIDPLEALRAE